MPSGLKLVDNRPSSGSRSIESGGRMPKAGNGSERKPTILMVEDEILIRLATADYLRKQGYRVLEASVASEALSVFAVGEPVELVFSDINIPGKMDGDSLAQWIGQYFPDVKVLLTSDETHTSASHEYRPVLTKPYSHENLLTHIKRLLMHEQR